MGRSKAAARKAKKSAAAAAAAAASEAQKLSPADEYKVAGNRHFKVHNYDGAVNEYSEGLKLEPRNTALLMNRSAALTLQKKFTEALADADAALAADPGLAKAHLRRGDALEGLLLYDQALAAFRAGLELDPEGAMLKAAEEKLVALLEQLRLGEAKESERGGVENPENDKFAVMVEWLREGGARHPALFMRYYSEDYRGVHALTRIPPETVILYVPHSHVMTSDKARASPIGRKLLDSQVDLRSKHSFLACFLLEEREKGADSFWHPYIAMLPEKYRNVPINFTPEELGWLKGSFTVEKIAERRETLRLEYENICRYVPEFSRHGVDAFVWARLVVITRIFGLYIDNQKTDGLVPYADMLNHKRPRETKWTFDNQMGGFTIVSCKTLHPGDEVFDSYGRKCNSRYFVNYGFALDVNEDNEAVLKVVLRKMDPQYKFKLSLLGGTESAGQREYQVPASAFEKKTRDLFSFLRLSHAQDAELGLIGAPAPGKDLAVPPLSPRNEAAVLENLARSATLALQGFARSMSEHATMLRQPRDSMHPNVRNAIVMVHGEQAVLEHFCELARVCVPMLKTPWNDLRRDLQRSYGGSMLNRYVREVVAPLVRRGGE